MYKKGEPINNICELLKQEFIFAQGRPLHKGWFMSWQFRFAIQELERGHLFYAITEDKNGFNNQKSNITDNRG